VDDPLPRDAKHLHGSPFIRIRVGDYRVVYALDAKTVSIALIDSRDVVYKRLRR
jgi:mRNA-degrading endonuclease RelE of RelBE toxin-antitoxin system